MRRELMRVLKGSAIYALPPIVARGIGLLTVPLYTMSVSPAEYGVMTLSMALAPLIATVIGIGAHMSTARLHFDYTGEEQVALHGTILTIVTVVPLIATLCLLVIGFFGGLELFNTLRFWPHLVPVLLTSYFLCFVNLPVNVYMVREDPRRSATYSAIQPFLAAGLGVAFVVGAGWGVLGYFWALCVASGVSALISVWTVARLYGFAWNTSLARHIVSFGAPLVPYLLSVWALSVSDRLVLEQFVGEDDLGRYALAYSFAMIAAILGGAIDRTFLPLFTRKLQLGDAPEEVSPIGTYILLVLTWASLGTAVLAPELIRMLTPPEFHGAADLVPVLVLGLSFQQLSQLWTKSIYLEQRTRSLGAVTLIAAAANIALNLYFIPTFGVAAAAWTTVAAYALQAALHGYVARTPRIRWEYRRWAQVSFLAIGVFAASSFLADGELAATLLKVGLCVLIYPLLLWTTGFFSSSERRALIALVRR